MMMNDAGLVASSLRGDRLAFGQIVERYQSMACAVAYSMVGELAASEDVAQDAFVAAWQSLASLKEPAKLRPWLAGVVRNMARSWLRKRGHDPIHDAKPVAAIAAVEESPEAIAARLEEEALLAKALAEVPEQFREPLVLYYREHQSISEVAATMDISEDAVKQRLARGRQALKVQVAEYVETALRRTGPKAAFTAGVLAAINSTAGKASAAAFASGATVASAGGLSAGAMMGLAGGIGGGLLGVAGGAIGTACSIRNTKTPAERALMIKVAWAAWIYTTMFVGFFLYVVFFQRGWFESVTFQVIYWTIHGLVLAISIPLVNRKASQLRNESQ